MRKDLVKHILEISGQSGFKIKAKPSGEYVDVDSTKEDGKKIYEALRESVNIGTYDSIQAEFIIDFLSQYSPEVLDGLEKAIEKNTVYSELRSDIVEANDIMKVIADIPLANRTNEFLDYIHKAKLHQSWNEEKPRSKPKSF